MQVIVYTADNESENNVLRAFYDGCEADKDIRDLDHYETSDVAVVFGTFKKQIPVSYRRGNVVYQQKARGKDVVILETGYIFRGAGESNYYAAGLNGLNGRADFKNEGSKPDRALQLVERGLQVKPWRESGTHILLCGQVPWDASVDHIDFLKWAEATADMLSATTKRPIVYRPHPLAKTPAPRGTTLSTNRRIEDDLIDCWCVVTFSSNSGVDAALNGIPVVAMDEGSMVKSITTNIASIENPKMPSRTNWLSDIAYAQWTPQEMREGLAWKHLFQST